MPTVKNPSMVYQAFKWLEEGQIYSGTLVDYIHSLEEANSALLYENEVLKNELAEALAASGT